MKKKLAAGVAQVSKKLLPLHPASTGGAVPELKPQNFFRSGSWKKAEQHRTFAARFRARNGHGKPEKKKTAKNFFFPVLGKSKNGVTFAPRFNRKRVTLKTEYFAKFASKKKFFRKACRKQKAAYLCNPLRSEGVTNTNTAPLASGPRLLPLRSDRRSLNDWKRQKR